jgi:hypothetical protein
LKEKRAQQYKIEFYVLQYTHKEIIPVALLIPSPLPSKIWQKVVDFIEK